MDIRQSKEWAAYMQSIGWQVEQVKDTFIFIRQIPLIHHSIIKIQHPKAPIPFKQIDQIAKKYKALCVILEPDVADDNQLQFKKNGYHIAPNMSYVHTATSQVDLKKSETQILQSFSENAKRNIKKALQNQLTIKVQKPNASSFNLFYKLMKELADTKKFYIQNYQEIQNKMLAFQKTSCFIFAYYQGQPINTVWLAFNKDRGSYLHTGINAEGYKLLANYLLAWEAIKISKKHKKKVFDFEGIYDSRFPDQRKRWKNFSEFKSRFHGNTILYPTPRIKCYNLPFKLFYLCSQPLWK